MKPCHQSWLVITAVVLILSETMVKPASSRIEWLYNSMSDASGAVPLGTNWFAVADDETNPIRIYRRDQGGPPVQVIDLDAVLRTGKNRSELDLEAAALLENRAFWIGSHGQNQEGKNRSHRHYFFATDIQIKPGGVDLQLAGKPYHNLLADLLNAPTLRRLNLAAPATKPPQTKDALNIEGLCAYPQNQLLIGIRNPVPQRRALLVPLLNPNEVIQGRTAQLGEPILLDLGGLGIRDLAYVDQLFYILAGPRNGSGRFRLYRWTGGSTEPQVLSQVDFKGYHPETIIAYPDKGARELQILCDDGNREVGGIINKERPIHLRQFRSLWIKP